MRKPSAHDINNAKRAVKQHKPGDKLGKNTKYLEDGTTIQVRIGATLRVWFCSMSKQIIKIFHKDNHQSHR